MKLKREIIGPPQCPLMYRWTLCARPGFKLLLHHFLPNVTDPDVHDHPRPFITLVLAGTYDDLVSCPRCKGSVARRPGRGHGHCLCEGTGTVLNERMTAGSIRRRRARHAHRTRTGPQGCWTVVLMGPKRREWGFWRNGRWFAFRDYERIFGFTMRCEDR